MVSFTRIHSQSVFTNPNRLKTAFKINSHKAITSQNCNHFNAPKCGKSINAKTLQDISVPCGTKSCVIIAATAMYGKRPSNMRPY